MLTRPRSARNSLPCWRHGGRRSRPPRGACLLLRCPPALLLGCAARVPGVVPGNPAKECGGLLGFFIPRTIRDPPIKEGGGAHRPGDLRCLAGACPASTHSTMATELLGGCAPFTPHFSATEDPHGHELVTRAMLDAAVAAAVEPLGTTLRLLAQQVNTASNLVWQLAHIAAARRARVRRRCSRVCCARTQIPAPAPRAGAALRRPPASNCSPRSRRFVLAARRTPAVDPAPRDGRG